MKKRVLLLAFLVIMLTGLVSAQFSYSSLSLSDFLDRINPMTVVLVLVFLISFAVFNLVLKRTIFSRNLSIGTMVALLLSFGVTYGINRMRWDWEGLLIDIGIPFEWLYILTPLVLLIVAIGMIKKFKFAGFLMIFGAIFLVISFFGLVYDKITFSVVGIIFILLGFLLWRKKKKRRYSDPWDYPPSAGRPRRGGRRGRRGRRGSRGGPGEQGYGGRRGRRGPRVIDLRPSRETSDEKRLRRLASQGRRGQRRISRRERRNLQRTGAVRSPKLMQETTSGKAEQRRQGRNEKMLRHLAKLAQKKNMELQKQQMMAAKGVKGADQRLRTLESEISEIARRAQRYQ